MSTRSRLFVLTALCLVAASSALAQQRGSISGRVFDPDGLVLPGATVTVLEQNTGFTRTVVTAGTGAYAVPSLDPGVYTVTIELPGFASMKRVDLKLTAGAEVTLEFKMQIAGLQEAVEVTGAAPLVERTSNRLGGSLSSKEIEDVPSNFRNFTALTQLIPGMTPNPASSSFEGGQVVANGTPSQSNLYLLDGMYNNDDRLGGSQGTQVRVVLDNIGEYQVLANQYSAEYGGGAGAIINMVSVGGTNLFTGRAYNYYRNDKFNATNYFVKQAGAAKPHELTFQTGAAIGGPIVKDRAFFYTTIERDAEDQAGLKKFPAEAAPLVKDFVGAFTVRVMNYFARGDLRINDKNFVSARWILELAPTHGENFNVNTQAPDARSWESDWDHLFGVAYTSVFSDRASNVVRVARVAEQLGTGKQAFFEEVKSDPLLLGQSGVEWVGYNGRDPLTLGQENSHPSYFTGKGGTGANNRIRSYILDESFSYFVPSLWGGEHTLKFGGGFSMNAAAPSVTVGSGSFLFKSDLPYNPANPATFPYQFDVNVIGPPTETYGFQIFARDRRYNFFAEDKWRVSQKVTFNVGIRYDYQRHTPNSKRNWAPRAGLTWDITGEGTTVVRGGGGRFYAYMPVSVDIAHQLSAVRTLYPSLSITTANDPGCAVLCPDMIADSDGNLGVATLSAAGIAYLKSQRDATLAGAVYNRNPRVDDPARKLPYQDSWNLGLSQELGGNAAVTVDYVGNRSINQMGILDINEPVNGVRPGPAGFDPDGLLIPAEARGVAFARVLQTTTIPAFDGDYKSLQLSFQKRMANRWSGRVAYTLQKSHYTGIGNPDGRRVWLDNEPMADYGRFASDRRQVLAMSGSVNPWSTLSINAVMSAITGSPINETVGVDVNKDGDNTDRPIKGLNDLTLPIRSALDSAGRAVINGMEGPGSFLVDMSFRYQIPLKVGLKSLDLFYDMFNILNHVNYQAPTGVRTSAIFMQLKGAQFPRQSQFGVRVRF